MAPLHAPRRSACRLGLTAAATAGPARVASRALHGSKVATRVATPATSPALPDPAVQGRLAVSGRQPLIHGHARVERARAAAAGGASDAAAAAAAPSSVPFSTHALPAAALSAATILLGAANRVLYKAA